MTSSGSAIFTHWIPCTDTEDKRLYIMKKVCVITGGGSGMGLATAKLVCEEGYYTILVGRTASKLERQSTICAVRVGRLRRSAVMFPTVKAVLRWPNTPPNAVK